MPEIIAIREYKNIKKFSDRVLLIKRGMVQKRRLLFVRQNSDFTTSMLTAGIKMFSTVSLSMQIDDIFQCICDERTKAT